MLIVTQYADVGLLELVRQSAFFNTIHLFKNPLTRDPTRLIADFDEADFPGYGALALLGFPPFVNGMGKGQMNFGSVTWVSTAPDPTQVIYGMYVLDPGNVNVQVYDIFDTPRAIYAAGVSIPYQLSITAVEED